MREYVLIEELLPLVFRDCPSVPREVALHELREAAIAFCTRTRYWREDLSPIQTSTDTDVFEYEVNCLAPDTRPVATMTLLADGKSLEARFEDDLDTSVRDWRTATGLPRFFTAPGSAWVRPVPAPRDSVMTLTGKIAVAPTRDGRFLLSDIVDAHSSTLAAMAKSTLMMMPGKPWTNPELSVFNAEIAERAMKSAATDAAARFSSRPSRRTRPVFF